MFHVTLINKRRFRLVQVIKCRFRQTAARRAAAARSHDLLSAHISCQVARAVVEGAALRSTGAKLAFSSVAEVRVLSPSLSLVDAARIHLLVAGKSSWKSYCNKCKISAMQIKIRTRSNFSLWSPAVHSISPFSASNSVDTRLVLEFRAFFICYSRANFFRARLKLKAAVAF